MSECKQEKLTTVSRTWDCGGHGAAMRLDASVYTFLIISSYHTFCKPTRPGAATSLTPDWKPTQYPGRDLDYISILVYLITRNKVFYNYNILSAFKSHNVACTLRKIMPPARYL